MTGPTETVVAIDWTRCDGHGVCMALAPEQFSADPWGYPIVSGSATRPQLRRVVAACPNLALRLEPARDSRP